VGNTVSASPKPLWLKGVHSLQSANMKPRRPPRPPPRPPGPRPPPPMPSRRAPNPAQSFAKAFKTGNFAVSKAVLQGQRKLHQLDFTTYCGPPHSGGKGPAVIPKCPAKDPDDSTSSGKDDGDHIVRAADESDEDGELDNVKEDGRRQEFGVLGASPSSHPRPRSRMQTRSR